MSRRFHRDRDLRNRDDLEFLPVLASLPHKQTVFEYLVGCWKRHNNARTALIKKVANNAFTMPLNLLKIYR